MKINHLRWLFYFLIILLAIVSRCSSPYATMLDPDGEGYLVPALTFLKYGHFEHIAARSWPYPLFLTTVLGVFKNINSVLWTQHFLGVISFWGIIVIVEQRWFSQFKKEQQLIPSIIAISLLACLFLDTNIIAFEKSLRPEGLILPTTILLFLFLHYYLKAIKKTARIALFFCCIAYSFYFCLLSPRFVAGSAILVGFILLYELRSADNNNQKAARIIAVVLAALIIFAPEQYLIKKYDPDASSFSLKQFFYSNAKTVIKAIDEGVFVDSVYERTQFYENAKSVVTDTTHLQSNQLLGYDIDLLQYHHTDYNKFICSIQKEKTLQESEAGRVLANGDTTKTTPLEDAKESYYYKWTRILILQYPTDILSKITTQIGGFFFKKNFTNPVLLISDQHPCLTDTILCHYLKSDLGYKSDETPPHNTSITQWMLTPIHYLFVITLCIGLGLFVFAEASFFTIVGLIIIINYILLVAAVHTFDNTRYVCGLTPSIYLFMLFCLLDTSSLASRKISSTAQSLFLLISLSISYICWEIYWYNQIGLAFIRWHTHIAFALAVCVLISLPFLILYRLKKSELSKNLLVLATALATLLLFIEAVLCIVPFKKNNAEKLYGFYISDYPNKNIFHTWQNFGGEHWLKSSEFTYYRKDNSLGFADKEWPLKKSDNKTRILTVGDSFTEGDGAPQDSSYPALLQKILGDNHEVMNAGTCGSDPIFNYYNIEKRLLPYKPDIVLQTVSENDIFYDISIHGGFERFSKDSALRSPAYEPLYAINYTSRLLFDAIEKISLGMFGSSSYSQNSHVIANRNKLLFDLLNRYEERAANNHFTLYIIFLPMKNESKNNKYKFDFSLIKKHIATLPHIKTIDLMPCYQEKMLPIEKYYWKQDGHHNSAGYSVMATCISESLLTP